MIFRIVGRWVSQYGKWLLAAWGLIFLIGSWTAPAWNEVVGDGEFSYLPPSAPSQVAETVYRESFSRDLLGSTAVIVVRRAGRAEGLLPQDREFIEDVLKPAIEDIAEQEGGLAKPMSPSAEASEQERSIIRAVRTAEDRILGRLLNSPDGKTTLVLIELATGFLDRENWETLSRIETLIAQKGELVGQPDNLFARKLIPPGLDLSLSGPAAVGRDLRKNSLASTQTIVQWTCLITVAGLLLFYRAPLLALVPLLCVFLSIVMTFLTLAHLARWDWVDVFVGLENYVVVVLAGLGLASSLLFIARENEIRFQAPTLEDAATQSLQIAGPTVAGGIFVALVGLGMLIFAEHGKFQQLGTALLIGGGFVLLTVLTLVPALLVFWGRWIFWPHMRTERISADQTWCPSRGGSWARLMEPGKPGGLWKAAGQAVDHRPWTVGLICLLAMVPLMAVAVWCHGQFTYGMLAQLSEEKPSVKGAEIIQEQFPAGTTGPVTLLIKHPDWQFGMANGKEVIAELSDALERRRQEFGIADIRSVAYPLGLTEKDVASKTFLERTLRHRKAVEYYVGDKPPTTDHVTKLEIVFADDPFARQSIQNLQRLRRELPELMSPELAEAQWHMLGAPANIRDLQVVTDRDRTLIYGLVVLGVLSGLLCLVQRIAIATGLVILGVLNFLSALGMTYAVLWVGNPEEFSGLDWQVPSLLFVILMAWSALGHWHLLARVREEQQRQGTQPGLLRALEREGRIFLAAGLITGGVFLSLLGGTLVGLKQLGIGLTCGVLLDTLLIRPFLIPLLLRIEQKQASSTAPVPNLNPLPSADSPEKNLTMTVPPESTES